MLHAQPDGWRVALDELRLYFQASLSRVGSPVGQRPVVPIRPERDPQPDSGALNLTTGQQLAVRLPALSADPTAHFLKPGLAALPTRPIVLRLDRAPWHKAESLRQFIPLEPRLARVLLPAAGPDLTPQQHIWKQARQAVSQHHPCPAFPPLCQPVNPFLDTPLVHFDCFRHSVPPLFRQFRFA